MQGRAEGFAATLALRNTRQGRIFIFGNGPSLIGQKHLLDRIRHDTFCCNRFVRWDGHFTPNFYICSTNAVAKGVEPSEPPFRDVRFLVSRRLDQLTLPDWAYVYKKESHELAGVGEQSGIFKVQGGGTQASIMAQLAVWMGYRDLVFLGIEQTGAGHNFDPEGKDPFHYFIEDETMLFARWTNMVRLMHSSGVTLTDCTPHGRLNSIIGYRSLEDVLADD